MIRQAIKITSGRPEHDSMNHVRWHLDSAIRLAGPSLPSVPFMFTMQLALYLISPAGG